MTILRWIVSPEGTGIIAGCALILWLWIDDVRNRTNANTTKDPS